MLAIPNLDNATIESVQKAANAEVGAIRKILMPWVVQASEGSLSAEAAAMTESYNRMFNIDVNSEEGRRRIEAEVAALKDQYRPKQVNLVGATPAPKPVRKWR